MKTYVLMVIKYACARGEKNCFSVSLSRFNFASSLPPRIEGDTMKSIAVNEEQLKKIKTSPGFIAALDQSGGSTPKALRLYGIQENSWSSDEEMFGIVHEMRTRIITSPSFNGERIIGAILFENTMDREIESQPTPAYLWNVTRVI